MSGACITHVYPLIVNRTKLQKKLQLFFLQHHHHHQSFALCPGATDTDCINYTVHHRCILSFSLSLSQTVCMYVPS